MNAKDSSVASNFVLICFRFWLKLVRLIVEIYFNNGLLR